MYFFIFCDLGVTRLADISLNDPISISIADEIQNGLKPASQTDRQASSSSNCMDQENFAVPEKLKQYVVMVPSKLRLVVLAAFILEKCKVRFCLHLYYEVALCPFQLLYLLLCQGQHGLDLGFEEHLVYREPQELRWWCVFHTGSEIPVQYVLVHLLGSVFGVKLCNPFLYNHVFRSRSHIDLIMTRELGEVCGNGQV